MSAEANKAVIRRFVAEVWNAGDLAAADELVHPAYEVEGIERGLAFVQRNVATYRAAFPDLEAVIEQMVVEGDWVAVRVTLRGTHLGPLGDIPPSGKWAEMREMAFWQVEGDRLRAIWSVGDALGLRVPTGALPGDAWHRPVREAADNQS
jgi:predicted ester cyclase